MNLNGKQLNDLRIKYRNKNSHFVVLPYKNRAILEILLY